MKKIKEALFFIVPLVILTVLPIVIFVFSQQDNAFMGNIQYLKLFLKDGFFWTAVINTYGKGVLFSFVAILIFTLVRYLVKCKFLNGFKVFYLINVVLGSAVSFVVLLINKVRIFGVPTYSASTIVSKSPSPIWESISIIEILLALQVGVLISFVFWLIELLLQFIKNKKEKNNQN